MPKSNFLNNITPTKQTTKKAIILAGTAIGAVTIVYVGSIYIPYLVFESGKAATLASMPSILPIAVQQHIATAAGITIAEEFTALTGIGFNLHTAGISAGIGSQAGKNLTKIAIDKIEEICDKYYPDSDFSRHFKQHKFETVGEFELINTSNFKEEAVDDEWVKINTDDDISTECSEEDIASKSSIRDKEPAAASLSYKSSAEARPDQCLDKNDSWTDEGSINQDIASKPSITEKKRAETSISYSDSHTWAQKINGEIKNQEGPVKAFYKNTTNFLKGLYKQCNKNFAEQTQPKPRSSSVSMK